MRERTAAMTRTMSVLSWQACSAERVGPEGTGSEEAASREGGSAGEQRQLWIPPCRRESRRRSE